MKIITIGTDSFLKKDIRKIVFETPPHLQLFNAVDVIAGNPSSPLAICFVYTWKQDYAPEHIRKLAQRLSNYAALTGFWRTTNGGRYALTNILANPNINKLLVLVFDAKDNGHLLVDALTNLWQYGTDSNRIILNCKAPNPKFEQVPEEAVQRVTQQADLFVWRMRKETDAELIEKFVHATIQEPQNAKSLNAFEGLEVYTNPIINSCAKQTNEYIMKQTNEYLIYDEGARCDAPYAIDLNATARNIVFEEKNLISTVGQAIQAQNLQDALEQVASFIFKNGAPCIDERGIMTIESRGFTVTILNPLELIPEHFDKKYIERYTQEFMEGIGQSLDEFSYTYHERIFKRWGNQVEKAIEVLTKKQNTRRCVISLWDPKEDLGNPSAPCLDFLWFVVRNECLELHATYRSHHLATVTEQGKLMIGEGALVPNIYALGTLQKYVAERINKKTGPLLLHDFSGHVYVSSV
jgi:thymidylate synthase (methanogen type)